MRFHSKKELHLLRKFWHLMAGLFFVYLYTMRIDQKQMLRFLLVLNGLYLFGEFIRFQLPKLNRFGVKMFKAVLRETEVYCVHSGVYFALSCLFAVAVFPKRIAVLSILFLAIGDPIASFTGILWGGKFYKTKRGLFKDKSLEGSIACFLVSAIAGFVILSTWGIDSLSKKMTISVLCAISAAVSEALPTPFDDNLSIPILSGICSWLLFLFFAVPVV